MMDMKSNPREDGAEMANVDHFKRNDVRKIAKEVTRELKSKKYENDVDLSRSHLNYSLMGETTTEGIANFVNNKIKEVVPDATKQMLGNMNPLCVAIAHLPVELEDRSDEDKRRFFETTLEFFKNRYGDGTNIAYAMVHRDEGREHIHIGFVPVTISRKTGKRTVSAASLVTQKDLEKLHPDFDAVIAKEFGMVGLVHNGRTEGKYTLKEYKARKDAKREMDAIREAIKVEQAELKEMRLDVADKASSLRAKEMVVDLKLSDADKELRDADAKLEKVQQMEQLLQQEQLLLRQQEAQMDEWVQRQIDELESRKAQFEESKRGFGDVVKTYWDKWTKRLVWGLQRKLEVFVDKVQEHGEKFQEEVIGPVYEEYARKHINQARSSEVVDEATRKGREMISDLDDINPDDIISDLGDGNQPSAPQR